MAAQRWEYLELKAWHEEKTLGYENDWTWTINNSLSKVKASTLGEMLNKYGDEGWELISHMKEGEMFRPSVQHMFVLKRQGHSRVC